MIILSSAIARGCGVPGRSLLFAIGLASCLSNEGGAALVDAELVLLVDTSIVVQTQDFNQLMDGYAQAFLSSAVLDAIQTGNHGIAVSLVFFGGPGTESVGVPWMHITDGTSASGFADAIRNAARPAFNVSSNIADGLNFATDQFGTETGNPANGFESARQAINLNTETFVLLGNTQQQITDARDQALSDGVEVINGITVGTFGANGATAYYEANIVGGSSGGQPGIVVNAPNHAQFPSVASNAIAAQILSLVPEPSASVLMVLGMAGVALRRRRES